MFILCNINLQQNKISVFDTSDRSLDTVALSQVALKVKQGKIKVYGLRKGLITSNDCVQVPNLGISVCTSDAKNAMYRYYVNQGIDENIARQKVGL